MEKMKHWNWKLIFHILAAIAFLVAYIVIGVCFSRNPEFKPFFAESYEPSPECLFGFGVAIAAFCMGGWAYNLVSIVDTLFPPKKGDKSHG